MSDEPPNTSAVDEQKVINDRQTVSETKAEKEQRHAAADFNRKTDGTGKRIMRVRVYSPFKRYYDGQAFSVSAENATGPFDILPRHHNFISLLSPCDLVVRTGEGDRKIIISGGIMHVKADQVIVFLDV